jgi:hypothetical protein
VYSGVDIKIIRYCGNIVYIYIENTKYIMHQIHNSLEQLHVRLSNLFARENHLHIHTLSLKGEVWDHKTRLLQPCRLV